jgi:nucleotide-binding universal stress UspA family protein
VQFLASHGIAATPTAVMHTGSVAQLILEQASALGAQLIVAGAFGRPRWQEFLLGSVTERLLEESTVPLFFYH